MSFKKVLSSRNRSKVVARRALTFITSATLVVAGVATGINSANAVPSAPVLNSFSESGTTTINLTVNFTPGTGGGTISGYQYSTDGGATWAECDSSNCNWSTGASTLVIQKMSSENNAMRSGSTYQLILSGCDGTTRASQNNATNANRGTLGLTGCGPSSAIISYKAGTGVVPADISTTSTVANGASNPTITVTGTNFDTPTTLSNFTIGVGSTGLTASSVTWNSSSSLTFTFSGTAVFGTITIQAKATAFNPAPSAASNTLSINVPATTPNAPTSVTGTVASSTQINLSWITPSDTGGATITDYLVYFKAGTGAWETFTASASTSTSRNITGLTNSTAYIFKVAAKNSVGYGPFSADSSSYTTNAGATVPETPTAISAGSATTTSLTVSWTAPAVDGGAAISDYWLQYSSNGGTTWETFTASASATASRTVTGLSVSTSYIFRVAAKNSVGYGPFSDSSTAVSTSANSAPAPAPAPTPSPVIIKLSKDKVCAKGDDTIVIHGQYLQDATVTIDGVAVTVRNNSSQTIGIKLDAGLEGPHVIKVTTSGGSATITAVYKNVDWTAFKVFDIPYIYKGGEFTYMFEAFGENIFRVTGNMPAGLVLDPVSGTISGIPTEEGVFNFVLHADGVCGNDVDVIHLDVDKEIPNAISYRIKFQNKRSNKITPGQQLELKKFLKEIKEKSPKGVDPVIYINGGAPEGEPESDDPNAEEKRNALCDILLTEEIIAQTISGIFLGDEEYLEIFVYWPVVR